MTPGVIVTALLVAGVVVVVITAGVVYLTAAGRDPGPMLQLVTQLVAAVGAVGSVVLQLAGRRTVAKVERNTGLLAGEVAKLPTRAAAPPPPPGLPPPPPSTARMPAGYGARHRGDT